jgi:hypothetical protein
MMMSLTLTSIVASPGRTREIPATNTGAWHRQVPRSVLAEHALAIASDSIL